MSLENGVKFCTNCGSEITPGARFCTNCGTKVEVAEAVAAEEKIEESTAMGDVVEEINAAAEETVTDTADKEIEKEKASVAEAAMGAAAGVAGAAFGANAGGTNSSGSYNGTYNSGTYENAGSGNSGSYNGGSYDNYGNGGGYNNNYGYNNYSNGYGGAASEQKYNPSLIECFVLFFKNYVNFKGRTGRREYWLTILAIFLVSCGISLFAQVITAAAGLIMFTTIVDGIFSLAIIIPSISLVVRRLHDRDKSGLFYLFVLIPIVGSIILFIWMLMAGTPGENRFGPIECYEELAEKHRNETPEDIKKRKKRTIIVVIAAILLVVASVIAIGVLSVNNAYDDYTSDSYNDDITIPTDDSSDDISSVPSDFDVNSKASYVGVWKGTTSSYAGVSVDISEIFDDAVLLIFDENGTVDVQVEGGSNVGSWDIKEGKIEIAGLEGYTLQYKDGILEMDIEGVIIGFEKQ